MEEKLKELLPEDTLKMWYALTAETYKLYDVDRTWNKGFGCWDIEYKYRRGGKTLCTLYAKKDAAILLITYGKAEREKFESIRSSFSEDIQAIYDKTTTYHDGKWLWIPIDNQLNISDIMIMLKIKRKPNRK